MLTFVMSIISDSSKLKFQCLVFSFSKECSLKNYYKKTKKKEKLSTDTLVSLHRYISTGAGMNVLGSEKNNFLPEFCIGDFYR